MAAEYSGLFLAVASPDVPRPTSVITPARWLELPADVVEEKKKFEAEFPYDKCCAQAEDGSICGDFSRTGGREQPSFCSTHNRKRKSRDARQEAYRKRKSKLAEREAAARKKAFLEKNAPAALRFKNSITKAADHFKDKTPDEILEEVFPNFDPR
jgi:hypothetical protein